MGFTCSSMNMHTVCGTSGWATQCGFFDYFRKCLFNSSKRSITSKTIDYNGNEQAKRTEQAITMNNEIRFLNVSGEGYNLKFKNDFILKYRIEDGCFLADYPYLNYYGYGDTYDELKSDFNEFIVINWKMYVDCSIEELSADAICFRNKICELIEER